MRNGGRPPQASLTESVEVAVSVAGTNTARPAVEKPHPRPVAYFPPAYVPPASDPFIEAPQAMWYVRPPSGGQFGPASADVMKHWIAEGRITDDSLVWREGWYGWQTARDVLRLPLPVGTAPQAMASAKSGGEPNGAGAVPESIAPAPLAVRSRKSLQSTVALVVTLGLISLILLAGLIYVVVT